jgi:biopolymer transport protein TolQ
MIADSGLFAQLLFVILVLMSIVSWGIAINKIRLFRRVTDQNARFQRAFRRRVPLVEKASSLRVFKSSPLLPMYETGLTEAAEFTVQNREAGLASADSGFYLIPLQRQAVSDTLTRVAQEQYGKLESWVVFLATTGNAAPFLGLLGTVVGITNAFVSIGARGSATLAIVAPGIAEALVLTAAGLVTAIPAVIAFNWSNSKLRTIRDEMDNFSLELLGALTKEQVPAPVRTNSQIGATR